MSESPKPVYWDSCVFLDYINDHPDHGGTIEQLLQEADEGKLRVLTSTITIAEVAFVRISVQVGHPFRRMSDTCFGGCRTPVSLDVGHLVSGGVLDN